ncbi:MAG TPA: metallophosphoesterase, partial [Armatimonadota bacterium]|nr:metallophosphoesterase [Armatimonadota bacterium]
MSLVNWLKAPADRDLIARWTAAPAGAAHVLSVPQPPDPEHFEFLAVGDTGDSERSGSRVSPQDAVAEQMAADAALPETGGRAQLVLHTGDVVYMTGERRLYDRNFRRPYAPFLTPESTVDDLVFRIPFLPVPGNHDYYDFAGWAKVLVRTPLLGAGVRAIAHELFAYNVPESGSGMGAAYMQAFVDGHSADSLPAQHPSSYEPGRRTRLPNRYYRFQFGSVDFFALDSNTLEAPPPTVDAAALRQDAAVRVKTLQARARSLEREFQRDQR